MYADLMTDIPGLEQKNFDHYFAMATVDFMDEIPVRFLHYNHLLENKKATNRPKDQLDIAELNRLNTKK